MKLRLSIFAACLLLALVFILTYRGKKTELDASGEGKETPQVQAVLQELPVAEDELPLEETEIVVETPAPTSPAPLPPVVIQPEPEVPLAPLALADAHSENPDYQGGNGTVLAYAESDWVRKIVRKCELDLTIGGMLSDDGRVVYESIAKKSAIGLLQDGDQVFIEQLCSLEYLQEPKSEFGMERGDLWYKILQNGTEGWICVNDGYLSESVPYYGNAYEILGTISSQGKSWTVRSMRQSLSVFSDLNIQDKPGAADNSVVYTIRPGETDPGQTNVEVTAMTEEEDTLEGMTDHWLQVSYKDYEGWIFGGYASAERGGPKYYIPEQLIAFGLGA